MNISCLIIDDEPLAGSLLEDYVNRIPYLTFVSRFSDAMQGLEFLKQNQVDLILLDINMPLLSGMELARLLPPDQKIIFTTAYSEYAVESYSVNAVDYLLKPITFERFVHSMEKVVDSIKNSSSDDGRMSKNIFIKSGKSMIQVSYRQIGFIEGLKDYVIFQLAGEKHIIYKKLKDLEIILPPSFIRIHVSFIINTDQIKKIEDNTVYIFDRKLPIGEKYRDAFLAVVRNKLI